MRGTYQVSNTAVVDRVFHLISACSCYAPSSVRYRISMLDGMTSEDRMGQPNLSCTKTSTVRDFGSG